MQLTALRVHAPTWMVDAFIFLQRMYFMSYYINCVKNVSWNPEHFHSQMGWIFYHVSSQWSVGYFEMGLNLSHVPGILPYQVWPSDYQSDLDNRCVLSRYKNEGCEQHEYSLWRHLFTDCSVEVTLRSDCLGRLNQLWIGQGGGGRRGFWTQSTYTGYPGSAG